MAFVESSNAEVRKMENSKKEKTKEKDQKDERLRELDNSILEMKTEIDKKKDLHETLKVYRKFITDLSDQEYIKDQDTEKELMLKEIKDNWI